jgi:polyphenol oxidase
MSAELNPVISPDLAALPGIDHAFFTRQGGVSAGIYAALNGGLGSSDDPAAIATNRARMAAHLGVAADHLISVYQVHSADAVEATGPWPHGPEGSQRPRADAMVTATSGVALGISTADCGPLLFADSKARVIGAAHAGWKGAFTGIIPATVAAMEKLGASRANITAVLGPCIGPTAYEVGPEFVARFVAQDAGFVRFFAPSTAPGHAATGHRMFDMPAFIALRAAEAGLGCFINLGLCTYSDPDRFFSYRMTTHKAEPDYGRLISAIVLK